MSDPSRLLTGYSRVRDGPVILCNHKGLKGAPASEVCWSTYTKNAKPLLHAPKVHRHMSPWTSQRSSLSVYTKIVARRRVTGRMGGSKRPTQLDVSLPILKEFISLNGTMTHLTDSISQIGLLSSAPGEGRSPLPEFPEIARSGSGSGSGSSYEVESSTSSSGLSPPHDEGHMGNKNSVAYVQRQIDRILRKLLAKMSRLALTISSLE